MASLIILLFILGFYLEKNMLFHLTLDFDSIKLYKLIFLKISLDK